MDLLKTIHELEELVTNSKRFPFSSKCFIEEETLIHLIDNIREQWPSALKEAEEITKRREDILKEAQEEAENIIEQAKAYAQRQVADDEITKAAKVRAEEILRRTKEHSQEVRNESIQYADQIFDHMTLYMQNIMSTIQTAKSGLKDVGMETETSEENNSEKNSASEKE